MNRFPTVKLGEVTTHVSSGVTPRGGESTYLPKGPVMFIRSQNVQMNKLDLDSVSYISNDVDENMARSRVKRGDVLLNITGASIGRVAPFLISGQRANVNQHVCIVRPDPKKLDTEFLAYLMSTGRFQREIDRIQHGGTRQALTFTQIRSFEIPIPPLGEQKRIAAILAQADAIRRRRREAIEVVGRVTAAVFLEMFGDPARNPKGWRTLPFAELLSGGMRNGESPARNGNVHGTVLTLSAITGCEFDASAAKEAEFDHFRAASRVSSTDFLICRGNGNRDLVGAGKRPPTDMPHVVFPDTMIAARVDTSKLSMAFLDAQWRTQHVRRQILQGARTTNGTYKINQQVLGKIELVVPPIDVQKTFSARASLVRSVLEKQRRVMSESDLLFESLVQRAFRGEL